MDKFQILISKENLQGRIVELAAEIAASGNIDAVIGVLTGSFIFVADLVRAMPSKDLQIRFVRAKSYGNGTEHGDLVVTGMDDLPVSGKNILLVDDIIDSGNTLLKLSKMILDRGAASVRTCALLDKPSRREVPMQADFVGFTIENRFAVGYGLDCADDYRSFPAIYVLDGE